MLVLTRKRNQSIMIGDEIEVTVLSAAGDKVRLGIRAPREVPVFRKEVYIEIQHERAAQGTPNGVIATPGVPAVVIDDALAQLGNAAVIEE